MLLTDAMHNRTISFPYQVAEASFTPIIPIRSPFRTKWLRPLPLIIPTRKTFPIRIGIDSSQYLSSNPYPKSFLEPLTARTHGPVT